MDIAVDNVGNISAWAKENGVKIFLADTRAQRNHTQVDLTGKVCFVLGCERYGIDGKWYEKEHELLKIPMLGNCDSLNVGVAGSILIYEALRQQA
jgi:TrmH family RNA methyltransferase